MSHFLRRIAPAVLVGTAAVVVVSTAGGGAEAVTSSGASGTAAEPAPGGGALSGPGSTGRSVPAPDPGSRLGTGEGSDDLEAMIRRFLDGDDNDDSDEFRGGALPFAQPAPAAPDQGGGASAGGSGTGGSGACDASEAVGPVVYTEWGPVQVAAQVSGGRVCGVRTIQTPDGDRKSMMINARAVPQLEQNVLAAGDTTFDGVSGATVTSDGYRESLQAILDGA